MNSPHSHSASVPADRSGSGVKHTGGSSVRATTTSASSTNLEEKGFERWACEHPIYGLIEVYVGHASQLREIDPGFPIGADADSKLKPASTEQGRDSFGKASKANESKDGSKANSSAGSGGIIGRYMKDSKRSLVVKVSGVVVARRKSLSEVKIELTEEPKALENGEYDYPLAVATPYVEIESAGFESWIREVRVKARGTVIELDAPAGSRAYKHQREMEESPFKRWFYPLAAGIGKGAWALFCLVLLPLIGKIMDPIIRWLAQFMPDWNITIPWPDINLPSIPWPEINLPAIPWPDINLPSIPWPDWTAPGWVIFLMDYTKVWMPIVIGLFVGIVAVRNANRSRQEKLKWERQRVADVLGARVQQLEELASGQGRDVR